MGCKGCGMAYSFFFSTQYHRADCPEVLMAARHIEGRRMLADGTVVERIA